jgi:hypothetical protein
MWGIFSDETYGSDLGRFYFSFFLLFGKHSVGVCGFDR